MNCGDIHFSLKSEDGLRLFVTGWVPGGFSTAVTVEDIRRLAMWLDASAANLENQKAELSKRET
jgi:hypothetical protein